LDAETARKIGPANLKGDNDMRSRFLAVGLAFLGGVVSAQAQTGVLVRVPFEFQIANMTLPAGEYVVTSDHEQVWVRVYHGNTVAVVQSNRATNDGGKAGKVIFNCYEKLCFLSQVWLPGAEGSRAILASKSEKVAARYEEPQRFSLSGKPAGASDKKPGEALR